MDGNQTQQIRALQSKINDWADRIRCRRLTAFESWTALRSGISKSLEYPLVTTRLNKFDCNWVINSLKKNALPALGVPATFPNAVVSAPFRFLGLGLPDLWFEQNLIQVETILFLGSLPSSDIMGCLLRNAAEALRLELGLPNLPFSYDFTRLHRCTTPSYLHSAWQFCYESNLCVKDHINNPSLNRHNDQFLMAAFLSCGYSLGQLRIFISDLSSGDGRCFLSDSLSAQCPLNIHCGYNWPRTVPPNAHAWSLWRNALSVCFLHQPVKAPFLLLQSLGPWNTIPPGWQAFLSPDHATLYQRQEHNSFRIYQRSHAGRRLCRPRFIRTLNCVTSLPNTSLPTATTGNPTVCYDTGSMPFAPMAPSATPNTWWGVVIHLPTSLHNLITSICNHTTASLTDGSYKCGFGTAGFLSRSTLHSEDDFILAHQTPGTDTIDPYRAELGGLYGILRTAEQLCQSYAITNGSITIVCDYDSALWNLFSRKPPRPSQPHYDLLQAARLLLHRSPLTWLPRRVQGHQDKHKSYADLDLWAKMNVDMDLVAKRFWTTLSLRGFRPFNLPDHTAIWSLWHRDHRVSTWTRTYAEQL